jgi:hypothetical protein
MIINPEGACLGKFFSTDRMEFSNSYSAIFGIFYQDSCSDLLDTNIYECFSTT